MRGSRLGKLQSLKVKLKHLLLHLAAQNSMTWMLLEVLKIECLALWPDKKLPPFTHHPSLSTESTRSSVMSLTP